MAPHQIIAVAVRLFAVWLLLGARGFRKLFWWMRNVGRPSRSEVTANKTPD